MNISQNNFLRYLKSFEFTKGKSALFSWLFWISIILFLGLYIGNIVILFLNPNQFSDFKSDQTVFLGFYNLNVSNNDLYLNWIPIFFGILLILITGINCLAYWLLTNIDLGVFLRKKEIIIIFITSIVSLVLIYVLNIFNKPLFNVQELNLVDSGWNLYPSNNYWTLNFNYVYDLSFVSYQNFDFNTYVSLSKFSVIWIIMIIITLLLYLISLFVCFYHSQCYLLIIQRKGN